MSGIESIEGVEVLFFPSSGNGKYMGGGYLKVLALNLQVRFAVFQNSKMDCGYLVSLPSHKDKNDQWVDDVTIGKDLSTFVYAKVAQSLGGSNGSTRGRSTPQQSNGSSESSRGGQSGSSATPTKIGINPSPSIPDSVPF